MKAITFKAYGPPEVLQLEEVSRPVPKDNEVLIRIQATAVNTGDTRIRAMRIPPGFKLIARLAFGFNKPGKPILGGVLSGKVEEVGAKVTQFKLGDEVFAYTGAKFGGYAEYAAVSEKSTIIHKPEGVSHEEAAAIPFGGNTALVFLRNMGKIQEGEKVLINGASGAIGTFALQLAKHFGAEVTGVCSSRNVELVKSLGADHVIDYKKEDFTQSGKTWDVIFDTVGNLSFDKTQNALSEKGRLLLAVATLPQMLSTIRINLTQKKKVKTGDTFGNKENLKFLAELVAEGKLKVVIDKEYPLEQMADAHRYVDTGRKRGNVVITVG
jgi:NADPH:quinone reductase-like Zn-dependent oxidoreductase